MLGIFIEAGELMDQLQEAFLEDLLPSKVGHQMQAFGKQMDCYWLHLRLNYLVLQVWAYFRIRHYFGKIH